ncbi:putative membrane protein [Alteromonas macleodii]|uniref:Membrane protein n=1 Tax=Alteromonas macleodii TaxID=28108 RepID=A0AB36FRE6_ALTMA|nr:putative membrane protein [Alteromonas macleodii]OES24799.1 putative membrane protein [Alteromonas macleodii]OES25077.1 putative membrane protein [Alteromonas macleodii]OES39120.1 putative membrane protein [Alteromonas macleodii]
MKTHKTIFKPAAVIIWLFTLYYVFMLHLATQVFLPAYFLLAIIIFLGCVFTRWAIKYPIASTPEQTGQ